MSCSTGCQEWKTPVSYQTHLIFLALLAKIFLFFFFFFGFKHHLFQVSPQHPGRHKAEVLGLNRCRTGRLHGKKAVIPNPSFHFPVPAILFGPPESSLNSSFKPQFPPAPSHLIPQHPFPRDFLAGPTKLNFAWVLSAPRQGFSGLFDPQKASLIGKIFVQFPKCLWKAPKAQVLPPNHAYTALQYLSIHNRHIYLSTMGKMQKEKSY